MIAVGIDPSTKTSTCMVRSRDDIEIMRVEFPSHGDTVSARMIRVTMPIRNWWRATKSMSISVACIEGYSHGSNFAGKSLSIEIGYEWRRLLAGLPEHPRVYEVPPTQVKKWATGKGGGDKVAVATALTKRYGREFEDDNDSDAFALGMIAAQIAGIVEPETAFQRDVVDAIVNPPPKPKRTRKKREND